MAFGLSAGAVAAIGAVGGAVIASNATRSAARTQANATGAAVDEQARQYDQSRADFAPWREAGQNALTRLLSEMDQPTSASDVMADPGYQFGLQQGQTALDRKVAAMGGRVSGAALKAAARFGTDYASTGYNAAYQRKQERLRRLENIAGLGQTATGGSASAGTAASNNIAGLLSSQGDAAASAQLKQASIWGNTGNQLAALYGRYGGQGGSQGYFPQWQPGGGFQSGNGGMGD
ncbi:MAG TPA: hypothetical protein VIN03_13815 [Roseateles sp.]